ncbi:MAG: hypothetical protein KA715_12705 [Xanthomonadaceae bacterium]|nr:hypothetical protein [Xanthomonadaceae bacterium]
MMKTITIITFMVLKLGATNTYSQDKKAIAIPLKDLQFKKQGHGVVACDETQFCYYEGSAMEVNAFSPTRKEGMLFACDCSITNVEKCYDSYVDYVSDSSKSKA